jgi:ABC-type polysaccharide/polyol phosphate export permease
MFEATRHRSTAGSLFATLELIYHSAVRDVRKGHRLAVVGLLLNVLQTLIFVATFYLMFWMIGAHQTTQINGEFVMYLMTGIFPFMFHTKAMAAVVRTDGPASAMMHHAPLNTMISICAAGLSALYTQMLSLLILLFFYHTLWHPLEIDNPGGALGMLMLSWFTGIAVGVIFLGVKPWFPEFATIASQIYARINMIASGKMFVANTMPGTILAMFDWNPLFHTIDQTRGDVFLNYTPHFSDPYYPIWIGLACLMIGLLIESHTRKHASISWSAGR